MTMELSGVAGALEDLGTKVGRAIDAATVSLGTHSLRLAAQHAKQDFDYDALLARQKEDQARTDCSCPRRLLLREAIPRRLDDGEHRVPPHARSRVSAAG
jgi:hypothetical protein